MNLILLDTADSPATLAADDPRTRHVRSVLKMSVGDTFDVGVVNGPRGKATITAGREAGLTLDIIWAELPPPPYPIMLLVGLPRPQTARRILSECTSMGVRELHFFRSRKAESSYSAIRLWTTGEWRRHLLRGAEQAFTTHIPTVEHYSSLKENLDRIGDNTHRIALDIYEASTPVATTT